MSLAKPWPHPGHWAPHRCQQEGQGCDTAVSAVTSLQAAGWDRLLGDHQPCSWHGGKPALCAYRLNCLMWGRWASQESLERFAGCLVVRFGRYSPFCGSSGKLLVCSGKRGEPAVLGAAQAARAAQSSGQTDYYLDLTSDSSHPARRGRPRLPAESIRGWSQHHPLSQPRSPRLAPLPSPFQS